MEEKEVVEAGQGRERFEETVERKELLRSIGHGLEETQELLDVSRPLEAERSQEHQKLEVVQNESKVG